MDAGATASGGGELGEDLDSSAVGGLGAENLGKVLGSFITHKVVTNLKMDEGIYGKLI